MRIHIQNQYDDPPYLFTRAQWDAAAGRALDIGAGHVVSFGATEQGFAAAMADAEALVTNNAAILALFPVAAPKLQLMFVALAGLDGLAPYDWLPPGVALLNNSGAHSDKAGEFAIMAVLMLANRIPRLVTSQRAGLWRKEWGGVLHGRRVTIVGLGGLGGAAATQCSRFGMHVTGVRTTAVPHQHCAEVIATENLDDALEQTEFLVLACPLTPATHNLLDRRRLALLPRDAGVVNIGRGALVDQDALCDLLDADRLGGAVLDVFTHEPIPEGDRLWSTPNLIISPHTSADDPASYNAASLDIFFDNLRALRDGRPLPNLFDPARGY
jgi:glyoxylate/hydroxypyruvate reductase A